MFEQVIYLGNENLYIEELGINRKTICNNSVYNPFEQNNIVIDSKKFDHLIKNAIDSTSNSKDLTFLLPDTMFVSKVLTFEKLPLSLKKKQELIYWKLENFLPAKESLYDIQYTINNLNVLTFALSKSSYNALNNCIFNSLNRSFNIVPEFLYILDKLKKSNNNDCLLIINREKYFTAAYIRNSFPEFIRTRIKTNSININEELNTVKKIVEEKWEYENNQIIVFGKEIDNYKTVIQEWK